MVRSWGGGSDKKFKVSRSFRGGITDVGGGSKGAIVQFYERLE